MVGEPKEVDKDTMMKFEFVRVKIACGNVNRVPAVVEGALGDSFYNFSFQREVQQAGITNPAWNQWVRKDDVGGSYIWD